MPGKKKILVVDDNVNFRQLMECALEDDFSISTASDGREGVAIAREVLPDLILMDVMMPNISGLEMARMLVAEEATSAIPIIVLTASQLDKGTPAFFKQERNVKLFIKKETPILEIVAAVKTILPP